MSGRGTRTTQITWDADQQRLKLARGSDTWEMMYDTVAGIPAVLLARNYVSSTTSYDYYVRMPGGELLATFDANGSNTRYCHFDALGSTVLMTNGTAGVSASKTYDAWGSVLAGSGSAVPYGYVGELGYYAHDAGSQGSGAGGLLQLGVRFYDPELGRFTQRDPIVNDTTSSYLYAGGDPVAWVDPSGEDYAPAPAYSAAPTKSPDPCGKGQGANCWGCVAKKLRECQLECAKKVKGGKGPAIGACLEACRHGANICTTLYCLTDEQDCKSAPKAKKCMDIVINKAKKKVK